MQSIITSKIIPFFYFLFGMTFLIFPVLPMTDVLIDVEITNSSKDSLLSIHRGIGILFICFDILMYRIFVFSPVIYRSLNSTFIFIFTLISIVGPIIYFGSSSQPLEPLLFSVINIAAVCLFILERKA